MGERGGFPCRTFKHLLILLVVRRKGAGLERRESPGPLQSRRQSIRLGEALNRPGGTVAGSAELVPGYAIAVLYKNAPGIAGHNRPSTLVDSDSQTLSETLVSGIQFQANVAIPRIGARPGGGRGALSPGLTRPSRRRNRPSSPRRCDIARR